MVRASALSFEGFSCLNLKEAQLGLPAWATALNFANCDCFSFARSNLVLSRTAKSRIINNGTRVLLLANLTLNSLNTDCLNLPPKPGAARKDKPCEACDLNLYCNTLYFQWRERLLTTRRQTTACCFVLAAILRTVDKTWRETLMPALRDFVTDTI
jgi:hypothetical protein